ncbi:MAG: transposase [Gemmatimonadetes bacterium]|nr:transposase [Gemmatimonadota bacterium]
MYLAECYLQGVSTRKVRHLVETLCGETVSASTVSRATKQPDAALAEWRTRRVDVQAYPQLIIDAHYERIRREGQVLSTAVLWVLGVAANGYREYLGVWVGNAESGPVWSAVFRDLHWRGLHGVQYVVSDEHAGLKTAVQRYFPRRCISAARCTTCGMRSARRARPRARRRSSPACGMSGPPHPGHGGAARGNAHPDAAPTLPAVAEWLEETLGDTLSFYVLTEAEARRRLRTTNALEREHEEIRRRTRVIRIFPNEASYSVSPPRSPGTGTIPGPSAATSSPPPPPST